MGIKETKVYKEYLYKKVYKANGMPQVEGLMYLMLLSQELYSRGVRASDWLAEVKEWE